MIKPSACDVRSHNLYDLIGRNLNIKYEQKISDLLALLTGHRPEKSKLIFN